MTTGIAYGPLGETTFVRHGAARVIRGGEWFVKWRSKS